MTKVLMLALLALTFVATSASAVVLWDQSPLDPNWAGRPDSQSGCGFSGISIFAASDIEVGDVIEIQSITTYYDPAFAEITLATQAYLHVWPKTGSVPVDGTDIPDQPAALVPITVTLNGAGAYEINASGLSIMLNPGDYWVGLTPIFPAGPFGSPNYHVDTTTPWGDASALYEVCGFFGPTWTGLPDSEDLSILIEGRIVQVPTRNDSWGNLKALYND